MSGQENCDLEQGMHLAESALAMIPANHRHRPDMLQDLSNRYYRRFERLGALSELNRAIQGCGEALESISRFPNRASVLGNLTGYLAKGFDRLGDLGDLEKAILYGAEAIESPTLECPDRAGTLGNLAGCFCSRFTLFKNVADLGEAIQHLQAAVDLLALDHVVRSSTLHNLATCFQIRYEHLSVPPDLDLAIQWYEKGLEATPSGHFNRGRAFISLGRALQSRSELTGVTGETERGRCLVVLLEAWHCLQSPPLERIHAARVRAVAMLLGYQSTWGDAGCLLADAVKLLPMVSPRFLERGDQEYTLCMLSQLAAHAASISRHAGATATDCLTLLKLGRGIIMSITINCRSNLLGFH